MSPGTGRRIKFSQIDVCLKKGRYGHEKPGIRYLSVFCTPRSRVVPFQLTGKILSAGSRV